MDEKVLQSIIDELSKGGAIALVTLTEASGSTPRKNGSIMSVNSEGNIVGSIGGGSVEAIVINEAIKCINNGKGENFSYDLSEAGKTQMVCGGAVSGYIKVFNPKPNLIIFGGGHLSQSLCKLTDGMNFRRTVIEDREEFKEYDAFKNVEEFIVTEDPERVRKINFKDSYIVIVTRGHKSDAKWLREVINEDYKYLGIVGSKKKSQKLKEILKEEGVEEDLIKKLYTPIGLDIADGTPPEIAVSILSEILLVKNNGNLKHMKEVKNGL
ncbi:XdhC family protein [Eubacterium multiforme]|uniref:Xanthine dehydrogenase accessory factor n=1 Tax=Eubacterium multiforme TaxID=83339 RepID=A0ABT9UT17_9FIRM|nr:XdhC/CoxI family protein [Eubacterium multiforme]MDQ0149429.1 xanthine dehydrogenase accessory factor [Eubacterium multiforme]